MFVFQHNKFLRLNTRRILVSQHKTHRPTVETYECVEHAKGIAMARQGLIPWENDATGPKIIFAFDLPRPKKHKISMKIHKTVYKCDIQL